MSINGYLTRERRLHHQRDIDGVTVKVYFSPIADNSLPEKIKELLQVAYFQRKDTTEKVSP